MQIRPLITWLKTYQDTPHHLAEGVALYRAYTGKPLPENLPPSVSKSLIINTFRRAVAAFGQSGQPLHHQPQRVYLGANRWQEIHRPTSSQRAKEPQAVQQARHSLRLLFKEIKEEHTALRRACTYGNAKSRAHHLRRLQTLFNNRTRQWQIIQTWQEQQHPRG